jgi:hypothetical protein
MAINVSNNILRSLIEKEKLFETNFLDWHRNMRIVLAHEKKLYVLDEPIPEAHHLLELLWLREMPIIGMSMIPWKSLASC